MHPAGLKSPDESTVTFLPLLPVLLQQGNPVGAVQKQADGTMTEGDATDAYGGSVATVESVLLRVIVVLRRGMRPLLLLDESLGAVADHYVPNVGRFLSVLCERMGMDVLAVSHNTTLVEAADKAYRIRKVDGAAIFREVR